ncbi:MAG: hypothetical protein ACRDOI_40335, partial [Trebonia sp.]
PLQQLQQLFGKQFPDQQARWAAQTLIHYVLGFVAGEQNHAELVRAEILTGQPGQDQSSDAFQFGLDAILHGLAAVEPAERRS